MTKKLFIQALIKICAGLILTGLLVFGPAGTLHYWNGWLFLGVLFLPMILIGIALLIKRPELLEKRLKSKESRSEQSLVIKLSGLMFVVGFIMAGI
ncbi:MAG: isoprenylcysteine carboxylmethyltransferase family protein, partial [Firmicutes bacterium]|nr:isoprenylcysteine carboxylmethyltransferase family protein [Bacillota bacterium]